MDLNGWKYDTTPTIWIDKETKTEDKPMHQTDTTPKPQESTSGYFKPKNDLQYILIHPFAISPLDDKKNFDPNFKP